jgi:hypothetical protein
MSRGGPTAPLHVAHKPDGVEPVLSSVGLLAELFPVKSFLNGTSFSLSGH